MSNLDILLTQEKLFKEVGSGKLTMEYLVHNSEVKGVRVFGSRKLLYNRSQEDIQNNEQALRDLVSRVADGLTRKTREVLQFSVTINDGKINFVEWHSQQDKRFDKTK